MVIITTILVGALCSADTYFFRSGKGLAGIAYADRKVTFYTYFTTDYDTYDEGYLHEDSMMAALKVVDEEIRPILDNLIYETVLFRVSGGEAVAVIDLTYNHDIEYYYATFSLWGDDNGIEITRDEYNEICKKVNGGEKFGVVQLFKKMKKGRK